MSLSGAGRMGAVALALMLLAVSGATQVARAGQPLPSGSVPAPSTITAPGPFRDCYHQGKRGNGAFALSSRFQSYARILASRAADDFVLRKPCTVRRVTAVGVYAGYVDAKAELVTFYRDQDGRPGAVVAAIAGLHGSSHQATLVIRLGANAVRLEPGHYWLSVQARMHDGRGMWSWMFTSREVGRQAVWKNPGDGFRTGCTTYRPVNRCFKEPQHQNLVFALSTR